MPIDQKSSRNLFLLTGHRTLFNNGHNNNNLCIVEKKINARLQTINAAAGLACAMCVS